MKTVLLLLSFVLIAPSALSQKMGERRYTVQEIDELRTVCNERYLFGTTFSGGGDRISRGYRESERVKAVEEMVRTYMFAGVRAMDIQLEDWLLAVGRDTVYVQPLSRQKKR